jgi:environmental stress-induced protein Ves
MNIHTVQADAQAPQAWRNGGGQTRELITWPEGADWRVRVSRADITADGPFSQFVGVQRWFAVLSGGGVCLQFAHGTTTLHVGDAPLQFDGAGAPTCTLVSGPTRDLNLMVRGGRGTLQPVQADVPWTEACALRGLYTAGGGVWSDGANSRTLLAHTLLWSTDASATPWTFALTVASAHAKHSKSGGAWWLGYFPEAVG